MQLPSPHVFIISGPKTLSIIPKNAFQTKNDHNAPPPEASLSLFYGYFYIFLRFSSPKNNKSRSYFWQCGQGLKPCPIAASVLYIQKYEVSK